MWPLKATVIPAGSVEMHRSQLKGRDQRFAQVAAELRDRYLSQRLESLGARSTGAAPGRCSWGWGQEGKERWRSLG